MILIALSILILSVPVYYAAWSLHKFVFVTEEANPFCSVCQHVTANYVTQDGKAVCPACLHLRQAN